ncbi:MAG TPA: tryptophan 7-halogenase [Bryobacteraceae bacterium]|nr:Tryptophan halogenase [Candidatus Sulfopaludibacter sp. SbA4]HYW48113.1 tryptophan 7-halogenase [Bryobacteraceae bacterium]
MRYDVAILGGGPAGAAAGLSFKRLRPALRIAIIEASRDNLWRAGETLPPGSREILQSLGCWEAFCGEGFLESFGTRAVWGGLQPYENEFLFSARGHGWRLDRRRFDAMLARCAQAAGVDLFAGTRLVASRRTDAGWHLRLDGGPGEELDTAFVVDATGRAASFAVEQGARRLAGDGLMAAWAVFPRPRTADLCTMVEARPEGWWYSSEIPGGQVVVAWMSDADLIRSHGLHRLGRWFAHLGQSSLTAARVVSADPPGTLRVCATQSQKLSQATGAGWIAAGDAASTFDPLSSQGILKALRSGKLASFAALDCLDGRTQSLDRYQRLVDGEYQSYCETKASFYRQEQRWPQSPFWRRRQEP